MIRLASDFRYFQQFFLSDPLPFGGSTVLSLARGPAGNRTTTGSLSATQECRHTNCTTRTTSANKSAATLKARSASLLSFGRWKRISYPGSIGGPSGSLRRWRVTFFPSNAFMASARSLNTFNCMLQIMLQGLISAYTWPSAD